MILNSSVYQRFDGFYRKWASVFQVLTGILLIGVSIFLAVVAVIVFNQQNNEHTQRQKEEATVRISCIRSRLFGPPLLEHLQGVEERLHLGALEKRIEYPIGSEHFVSVLQFYRSTIPKKCP